MALGGGMSCVKYLLFGFNLLFAITGLILLIVGIKTEINTSPYIDLTDAKLYTSAPVVLIIVAIIVFIVAFFGCCGAVKENHCMIVTFSVFLLIIIVAELAVGIAAYIKRDDLEDSITKHLQDSISQYPKDPSVKKAFDVFQTDLSCCGINGPTDWKNNSLAIPDSCCSGQVIKEGVATSCTETSATLHHTGCLAEILKLFKGTAMLLGGVGLGIAIVQVLGVTFACCLARSIRNQYETV